MTQIKKLPKDARPREKLITHGPSFLTNAELFAILLGSGTKKEDVGDIAGRIFPEYSDSMPYTMMRAKDLADNFHIPQSHACKLLAFFELAGRFANNNDYSYITSPTDIFKRYTHLAEQKKEQLVGIYLNARSKIIHEEVISLGTVDTSLISPREVLQPAIRVSAISLIICHNHPSGDPTPSDEDVHATKSLSLACKIMQIKLLDHVIIGHRHFCSIRQMFPDYF